MRKEDFRWKGHEKISSDRVQVPAQLDRKSSEIGLNKISQKWLFVPNNAPNLFLKNTEPSPFLSYAFADVMSTNKKKKRETKRAFYTKIEKENIAMVHHYSHHLFA